MKREALKRRHVFWMSTIKNERHPGVVIAILSDRIVVATGTEAEEPTGEKDPITVHGQQAALMGLADRTRFYKMHVMTWNRTPPIEAGVIATCLPSLFPRLERMAEVAAQEHAAGTLKLKAWPSDTIVPMDLVGALVKKK